MHVTVERKALLHLVKQVVAIAKSGEARPILRNLLITANTESLEVTATDMSVSLWLRVKTGNELEVHKTGSVLVTALTLQRVLDSITSDRVQLSFEPPNTIVTGGNSRFELITEDPKDFPRVTGFISGAESQLITAGNLKGLMKRTTFCAHSERSYYNMHGVLIKTDGSQLTMVATNGQRLAVGTAPLVSKPDAPQELVVPADSIDLLLKIIGDDLEENVELQWTARALNLRGGRGEATLIALQGGYPPYQMGIPSNTKHLRVNRLQFIALLKQASALRGNNSIFVELILNHGKMLLKTKVRDSGISQVSCESDWSYDEIKLYLNPDFLSESAKTMVGEFITLELEEEMDQPVLREHQDGDIKSFCVYSVVRQN